MGLFKKKADAQCTCKCGTLGEAKVVGISEAEYDALCKDLVHAYEDAKSRQKSPDAAPTKYMMGLEAAYDIVKNYRPHEL